MRKRKPITLNQQKGDAEKAARRRYRERMTRDQEAFAELVEEGSRLMDKCGIPYSVKQVPDWLIPLAAYSMRKGLKYSNYRAGYHDDLYGAVRAGFRGDLLTVEMWMMAHEYDD